ncbi:hypothetical protein EDD11_005086 [Mortierella claussenii]|nr:hypothetical protein EDD11_005086 [Mortierella claussenii]
MVQQQLIQRYQQHRQLQQKQQQARQQQQLRQQPVTPVAQDAGVMNTSSESLLSALDKDMTDKLGGFNSVKTLVPPECANCMALDTLTTHPRVDAPRNALASSSLKSKGEDKFLCSACLQYLETRGKSRPVPPYRVNFLKKIHCRFKKRLHEVRFQGWQDAQVLELEDRMTSHDFHAVFYAGVEDGLVMSSQTNSRQISASSTAASSPIISSKDMPTPSVAELPIVIKIEDDDDEMPLVLAPPHAATETRTFANEASVGELFGHRWKSEPMVGYTLVHFGGSDRTRMVPMNPTVPSLTITFRPESESVLFAFRVLVNGLCLLSSGGGPPALHMPEMADDDESEEEPETEDAATSETAMKVAGAAEDQCVGVMPDSDSEQQCKVDNEGVDNPHTTPKKPLQSRHRNSGISASNNQQQPGATPGVPRMLRRMTKQSFMDVDLQYLMNLDPATPDPFENSSAIFDDPPSLFRPLPVSIMSVGGPGTGQWMSTEAIRLQKEQEDLRVQYLQFLHQLHQNNAQGFLVHMNTFASEYPQEFSQLQAYIRYQEQVTNQQREEARRQEEMRQYQLQLEHRRHQEQELQQYKQFQEMQSHQEQVREMQQLLQEWLFRRQQSRANSFRLNTNHKDDGLDLADVFTIALQKDPKLVERMMTTAGPGQGLNLLLTPDQQQEFNQFLEQRRIQDLMVQEKKKQDMMAAGFSGFAALQPLSGPATLLSSASSSSSTSAAAAAAAASLLTAGIWGSGGSNTSNWMNGLDSGTVFPSRFQPRMTNEQYLKRNSKARSK